jgi:hypothetical protein
MYNITNDDFKFVERPEDDFYTIHLLTGEWVETKFQFGQVQVHEEDNDGGLRVAFDWTLIEGDKTLKNNVEFQNYIGDVLTHVITDSLEAKIGEMPNDSTVDTDNDSEESAK